MFLPDQSLAFVQSFYEKLDELQVDFHEFHDPLSDLKIIICKSTPTIRRRLDGVLCEHPRPARLASSIRSCHPPRRLLPNSPNIPDSTANMELSQSHHSLSPRPGLSRSGSPSAHPLQTTEPLLRPGSPLAHIIDLRLPGSRPGSPPVQVDDQGPPSSSYGSSPIAELLDLPPEVASPMVPDAASPLIYSVTSHNRKALQKRAEQAGRVMNSRVHKASRRQIKPLLRERGMPSDFEQEHPPASPSEEPDSGEDNSMEERTVETPGPLRSRLRTRPAQARRQPQLKDPWFQSQLVQGSLLSYPLQAKIYKTAMAIAGSESVQDWQQYFRQWRKYGLLTSRPSSSGSPNTNLIYRSTLPVRVQTFCRVFDRIEADDIAGSFRAITQRIRYVELWNLYLEIEASPPGILPPHAKGQTHGAQAKRFLFNSLYPQYVGVADLEQEALGKGTFARYSYILSYAHRWHLVKEQLGTGVLGLIPSRSISNNWVQRGLKLAHFKIWLDAILQFNPGCVIAGQQWATTLTRAMRGIPPTARRKALEDISTTALTRITDPATLFTAEDPAELAESSSQDSVDSYSQLDQMFPEVIDRLDYFQHQIDPGYLVPAEPAHHSPYIDPVEFLANLDHNLNLEF